MNEYSYDQIKIGLKESFSKMISSQMEDMFRELSGDINPLHRDDDFAVSTTDGRLKGHVAFGMLTASLYSTFAGVYLPGRFSMIHSLEIDFVEPVYVGDTLTVEGEVTDKRDSMNLIVLKVVIRNQNNKKVSKAKIKVMVLK